MLITKQIETAKPKEKQYRLTDGQGLYLQVMPSDAKYWRYNCKVADKQATISYGVYPEVSLAMAHEQHAKVKEGGSDSPRLKMPSFRDVAQRWYEISEPRWKTKHSMQVWATLDAYVFPLIGDTRIDRLPRAVLAGMMKEIDARGVPETAHRVAQRVRAVLDYAVDEGVIETHAGSGLTRLLKAKAEEKHLAAIPVEELPELMMKIGSYQGEAVTRIALLLRAHTFVRTGELIGAKWAEIDGDVWVVPAERMKRGRPHVVPLSKQVRALLEEVKEHTGKSDYVLATYRKPTQPISNNAMLYALYRLGYHSRMTGHGFRSIASSVLNEQGFH